MGTTRYIQWTLLASLSLVGVACKPRTDSGVLAGTTGPLDVATLANFNIPPIPIPATGNIVFELTSSKVGLAQLAFRPQCKFSPNQADRGFGVVTVKDSSGTVISSGITIGNSSFPQFNVNLAADAAGKTITVEVDHQGHWVPDCTTLSVNMNSVFKEIGKVPTAGSREPFVTMQTANTDKFRDEFAATAAGNSEFQYTLSFSPFQSGTTDVNRQVIQTSTIPAFPAKGFVPPTQTFNSCATPIGLTAASLEETPPGGTVRNTSILTTLTSAPTRGCDISSSMLIAVDNAATKFAVAGEIKPFAFDTIRAVTPTLSPSSPSSNGLPFQNLRVLLGQANGRSFNQGVNLSGTLGTVQEATFIDAKGDLAASVYFKNPAPQTEVVVHGSASLRYPINRVQTTPELRMSLMSADGIDFIDLALPPPTGTNYTIKSPVRIPRAQDYVITWQIINPSPGIDFSLSLNPQIEKFSIQDASPDMLALVKNADTKAGDELPTYPSVVDASGQEQFPRKYHDDLNPGSPPVPASAFAPFQGQVILSALEDIRRKWHTVIPVNTTIDPSTNITDASIISSCLQNTPEHWSDLILHYYCQYPGLEIRNCYTGAVRAGQGAIDGMPAGSPQRIAAEQANRDQAFDKCSKSGPTSSDAREALGWKWLTTATFKSNGKDVSHLAAFRYVMDAQVFAYSSLDQENTLNAFYRVPTSGGSPITADNCKAARPARSQDDQSGNWCLSYDFCLKGVAPDSSKQCPGSTINPSPKRLNGALKGIGR